MTPTIKRLAAALLVAAGIGMTTPAVAGAVVEPEYYFATQRGGEAPGVRLYANPGTTLEVRRAGAVVATGPADGTTVPFVPVAGDVLAAVQGGQTVSQIAFDGRPTIDQGLCAGATTLAGDRSAGPGELYIEPFRPHGGDRYAPENAPIRETTTSAGERYTTTFSRALPAGWGVFAGFYTQSGNAALGNGLIVKVEACPVVKPVTQAPPPPPVAGFTPVADRVAPFGTLRKGRVLPSRPASVFSAKGCVTTILLSEIAKVVQLIYLDNGAKLTAAAKRKRRKPVLLARGAKVAKAPGELRLRLKPTKAGKRLRRKRSVRVAIVTTLTDPAGNTTTLPIRRQRLTR